MEIIIQTPGFKSSTKLNDYIDEHLMKLSVLSDRILQARVILKLEKSDTKENKVVEVTLNIPGNDLFTRQQSHSFEEALLQSVDALKRQITRWKDSVSNSKARGSVTPLES